MDSSSAARFKELALRAEKTGAPQETRFLNMAEQSELISLKLPAEFFGGFEGAERRIAVFGAEEGYVPPVACVRISPASKRFAPALSHRDFLGALMALGLTREMLGDIIVSDGEAYLFCMDSVADYIARELTEVGRAAVSCGRCEAPSSVSKGGSEISVVTASERLDAVIAAVWKLPREEAKLLCEKGMVFVNARLTEKAGAALPEGAAVSVRGKGRFTYLGVERETKKGRLRVRILLP